MRPCRSRLHLVFSLIAFTISALYYLSVFRPVDLNGKYAAPPSAESDLSDRARSVFSSDGQTPMFHNQPDLIRTKVMTSYFGSLSSYYNATIYDSAKEKTPIKTLMKHGQFIKGHACKIPEIDPFHELAMKEMVDVGVLNCSNDGFSYVDDGCLVLKAEKLRYAHLQYILRPAEDDSRYVLSEAVRMVEPEEDMIRPGNVGCLIVDGSRVLEFEDDSHVVSSTTHCPPESFMKINNDGSIWSLHGKALTVQDCSPERCALALDVMGVEDSTRFRFEMDGRIKHVKTSMCMVLTNDAFGDYEELVLLRDCEHPASRWTMYNYPEKDSRIKRNISGDFVKLSFIQQDTIRTEYHAIVVPKIDLRKEGKDSIFQKDDIFNVALIMLESQSAANVERKMPHLVSYLRNATNWFIFKGHTIVGDGTTDQLCAMLVGRLERDLPNAFRSSINSGFVDDWGFIFADFQNKGYTTLFSEDDTQFSAFHYRLNGFRNAPAHHYARAFWQCVADRGDKGPCIGNRPHHKVNLDYTESLFDAYKEQPKFSVTVMSSLSHNNMNNIQYVENDLKNFLINMERKGHLRNTFVFLVGDHGLRASAFRISFAGWLEERLPFFALLVPEALLHGDAARRSIILENARYLTSHFDIYATLHDILNTTGNSRSLKGKSLLKPIDHKRRTCELAGVGYHWCPCNRIKKLASLNAKHVRTARAVVDYLNHLLANATAEAKCARLKLEAIKKVSSQMQTNLDLVDRNLNQTEYLIVISVAPSGGIFEATVARTGPGNFIVDPSISRLDFYGNQSLCIVNDHPNLRKYCFCKSQI